MDNLQTDEEADKSTKEQMRETFDMLCNGRIATLYPLMAAAAINLAIFASVFVKIMVATMTEEPQWDDQEKTSNALLCMLGLGVGEILGSLAFGRVTDKLPPKQTILINAAVITIAYGCLVVYGAVYDFSFYLGVLMTFTWGV